MAQDSTSPSKLKLVRTLLWASVALAVIGFAALLLLRRAPEQHGAVTHQGAASSSLGGDFTLVGSDGKAFPSTRLTGEPYAIFFGFTRCGDVCPTTLGRLTKLREQADALDALNIVFVTIDPKNDGPREVGQYAERFGSPIIGLTGTQAQIDAVKKQYAIYAEPVPHAPAGQAMGHTSSVLLFDGAGKLAGTISPNDDDATALEKIRQLVV